MNGKKIKGDKFSSKEIIIGIAIAVLVIGGALFAFLPGNKTKPVESEANNSNTVIAPSYPEAKNTIVSNKENAIVVVGNDGCVYCVNTKPIVADFVKDKNAKFYYVDSTNAQNISALKAEGINVEGTPTTFFYKNGQLVNNSIVPDELEKANNKDANAPFTVEGQLNPDTLEQIGNAIKLLE